MRQMFWFYPHFKDEGTELKNGKLCGKRIGVGMRHGFQSLPWLDLPGLRTLIYEVNDQLGEICSFQTGIPGTTSASEPTQGVEWEPGSQN